MLGRRQGEVAPTRKVALKIEMPPLRPTGAKPTLWHPALTSCRIRAAGLWARHGRSNAEVSPFGQVPRVNPFGGLVSAREGWPTSEISSPNQAFHDSIRAARVI